MTNNEIIGFCAHVVGLRVKRVGGVFKVEESGEDYNPLKNEKQAMVLKTTLGMKVVKAHTGSWLAGPSLEFMVRDKVLNRAICRCAAIIQKDRISGKSV